MSFLEAQEAENLKLGQYVMLILECGSKNGRRGYIPMTDEDVFEPIHPVHNVNIFLPHGRSGAYDDSASKASNQSQCLL